MNLKQILRNLLGNFVSLNAVPRAEFPCSLERNASTLISLGAKTLSPKAVEDMITKATEGGRTWYDLIVDIDGDPTWSPEEGWETELLASAFLLNCVIWPDQESFRLASKALTGVIRAGSPERWAPELRMLSYQAATIAANKPLLAALTPYASGLAGVSWATRADLALPPSSELVDDGQRELSSDTGKWWKIINEPFVKDGLEAWELLPEPSAENLFLWIHAPEVVVCGVPAEEQPLVSIVVPVYRPDKGFFNTIESLIRQSWQNIEIIIVDDASPTGNDIIERAVEMDPRISLVTMEQNSGAYPARNAGFEAASGEFVTVLDADDLSHPRRIELQVKSLWENPEALVSGIAGIRMYADGILTMYGFYSSRRNYSAFMFRRHPIMEALGRFDDVRKSGDVEFHARVQAAFGADAIVQVRKHLSITQLTPGSLSRNDSRYVWLAGERLAYAHQYRGWLVRASSQGRVDSFHLGSHRNFVAPAVFTGHEPPRDFKVAILRDWSAAVPGLGFNELASLGAVDPDTELVGLLEGIHPEFSDGGRATVSEDVWEAVEAGAATWLPWARKARIGTLVIEDPAYALWLPARELNGLHVERVRMLKGHNGSKVTQQVEEMARARCKELFGRDLEWIEEDLPHHE